ncbi:MAG: hypothetical protein V1754_04015, partial [Pseudomonadota bacterium]
HLTTQVLSSQTESLTDLIPKTKPWRWLVVFGVFVLLALGVVRYRFWPASSSTRGFSSPLAPRAVVAEPRVIPMDAALADGFLGDIHVGMDTKQDVQSKDAPARKRLDGSVSAVRRQEDAKEKIRPRTPKKKIVVRELPLNASSHREVSVANELYQKGLQELFSGEFASAVSSFNRVLAKDSRFALAYRGLGLAFEKMGQKTSAKAAYRRYLVLRPKASDADAIRVRMERLNR